MIILIIESVYGYNMKVIIFAGGFGTRLKEITKNLPKQMVNINGKPFLYHQMKFLKNMI